MEAPDKIFLLRFVYEKWIYQTSDSDDMTEVEYIRKDALTEWADNWKKLGVSDDFLYAMEILVRHINSL